MLNFENIRPFICLVIISDRIFAHTNSDNVMKQQINRSEVLTLAHQIRRQNQFLTWGQCQAQAWKVARLRLALRAGAARFTFQKQDGEMREAYGTLNPDLFRYEHKGGDRAECPTAIKYFDLDKNAWRSFRAERIMQVAA